MRLAPLLFLAAVLGGCGTSGNIHKYTQSQITAITTRQVDASMGSTFSAASNALFDAGYTIAVADRDSGILTGLKKDDKSAERFWINPYMPDTEFRISALLAEDGPRRTKVRVSMSLNGEPLIDEEAVDQFWTLMKRQVLIQEPLVAE